MDELTDRYARFAFYALFFIFLAICAWGDNRLRETPRPRINLTPKPGIRKRR